jgi:hypothetical protein
MPTELTSQHPPLPLEVLVDLKTQIASGVSLSPALEKALRALVRAHPLLSYTWETGHTFWRGRTRAIGERYAHLEGMLWPPTAYAKLGRGNVVGESILYICDHLPTCVAELSDQHGCPMQFTALEIRPGDAMRFAPIGELVAISQTGQSLVAKDHGSINALRGVLKACPPEETRRLIIADQLIFEAFALPGRHDVASVVAHEIRNKLPELDGVIYGSTKRPGAKNIAMRPSSCISKCQVIACIAADKCLIADDSRCRIEGIEPASAVDDTGAFVWSGVRQFDTKVRAFLTPYALQAIGMQST